MLLKAFSCPQLRNKGNIFLIRTLTPSTRSPEVSKSGTRNKLWKTGCSRNWEGQTPCLGREEALNNPHPGGNFSQKGLESSSRRVSGFRLQQFHFVLFSKVCLPCARHLCACSSLAPATRCLLSLAGFTPSGKAGKAGKVPKFQRCRLLVTPENQSGEESS